MALKFYDRTKEEATTTGTGTFSLSGTGADGGFRAFSAVHATGDEVFYCAVDSSNNAFEVGKGTLTSGTPWTLSRTEIKLTYVYSEISFSILCEWELLNIQHLLLNAKLNNFQI